MDIPDKTLKPQSETDYYILPYTIYLVYVTKDLKTLKAKGVLNPWCHQTVILW